MDDKFLEVPFGKGVALLRVSSIEMITPTPDAERSILHMERRGTDVLVDALVTEMRYALGLIEHSTETFHNLADLLEVVRYEPTKSGVA